MQIQPEWIYYGACDPSMGKGESSHPSALLVGGFHRRKRQLNVIAAKIKRRVPSKLIADMIALQREFPQIICWGFENNNAYEYMRKAFMNVAIDEGVSLPLVPITATISQEERIESLEPFVTDAEPNILFHASQVQLQGELDDFPEPQSHHHFDGLCALHILWTVAVQRAGGIPSVTTQAATGRTDLSAH